MKPGLVTLNVLKIARVFVEASSTCVFTGYGIAKSLDMDGTTVWQTLRNMEARGWLRSEFEGAWRPGRPPKRLYSITESGRESAVDELRALQIHHPPTATARSA